MPLRGFALALVAAGACAPAKPPAEPPPECPSVAVAPPPPPLPPPYGPEAAPSWIAEGNQVGADLGDSVASAGDVNGDGFDDVIVGVSDYDDGELDEGLAYVYLGSAAGHATRARVAMRPAD